MMILDKYGERGKFFCSGQLEIKLNLFTDGTHSCSVGSSWRIAQKKVVFVQRKNPGDLLRALDGE